MTRFACQLSQRLLNLLALKLKLKVFVETYFFWNSSTVFWETSSVITQMTAIKFHTTPSPASITTRVKFSRVHRSHLMPLALSSPSFPYIALPSAPSMCCLYFSGLQQIHCDVMVCWWRSKRRQQRGNWVCCCSLWVLRLIEQTGKRKFPMRSREYENSGRDSSMTSPFFGKLNYKTPFCCFFDVGPKCTDKTYELSHNK